MGDLAVQVEGLGKRYRLGASRYRYRRLTESMSSALRLALRKSRSEATQPSEHWALRDVNIEIEEGTAVGIIGHNGAGKTTLLKILSRITEPTTGRAILHGSAGSLLEVGTGFHPELTGRENVYLNGAILGMGKAEIRKRFDEIVQFAGVERFLDTPVKRYSSGMYVRLAFSVAAHLEPEILIVDEVLAVGDVSFQKKCLGRMSEVASGGRTVLFVSHNMAAIQALCDKGVVLDAGRVRFAGTQSEAVAEYLRSVEEMAGVRLEDRVDRSGSGDLRITEIQFRDQKGNLIDIVHSGQTFDVCLKYEMNTEHLSPEVVVSLEIKTQLEQPVALLHNRLTGDHFGTLPRRGAFVCTFTDVPLTATQYRIGYSIQSQNELVDAISSALDLTVVEGDFFGSGEVPPSSFGPALIRGKWRVEEVPDPDA